MWLCHLCHLHHLSNSIPILLAYPVGPVVAPLYDIIPVASLNILRISSA